MNSLKHIYFQIFVPTYGVESVIVIKPSPDTVIDAENGFVKAGKTTINELGRFENFLNISRESST